MTYEQALNTIHSREKFGIKPGLERISELLRRLGNPQKKLRVIHVAGTNGKGSISYMCASILKESGYKTGLYVSPFVVDFRERIQINFELISKKALARLTAKVARAAAEIDAEVTEFEFVTAVALCYYAEQKCDYVVLEVGLGGRLDATNVIEKPLVSVIASISFDHMSILGDTLQKIAYEKCGIIKPGCPTVLYPVQDEEVIKTVKDIAQKRNSALVIPDIRELADVKSGFCELTYRYKKLGINSQLWGEHQVYNGITVIEAMSALSAQGVVITEENIVKGIAFTRIPARLELICKNPPVLLDVAHNPDGINALSRAVKSHFKPSAGKLYTVMGMCSDKEHKPAIAAIAAISDSFFAATPISPRALSAEETAAEARLFCTDTRAFDGYKKAIDTALNEIKDDDALLVCGSFYLASPAREYLQKRLERGQRGGLSGRA